MRKILFLLVLATLAFSSCRNTISFNGSNVELNFSQDTIFLDTVFTGLGSSTRMLKVFNPSEENVFVDRVYLGKGTSSFYRVNVDGIGHQDAYSIEILAGDSAYIFIEISPDAAGADELIYTDSLWFENGSKKQAVALVTAVWDAYYHFPNRVLTIAQPDPYADIKIPYSILDCAAHWSNDKPHVVYGYAVIDSACSLNIDPGVQVHFHNGSGLWVYRDGQLAIDPNATGSMENPTILQGDRLEPYYEYVPGQWGGVLGGIFVQGGAQTHVTINNTFLRNGTTGIRTDSSWGSTPNIQLHNTILSHFSRMGIYSGFGNIEMTNVAIGPSGVYGVYALGGTLRVDHSSIVNSWTFSGREGTALGLANYFEDGAGNRYTRALDAHFTNTIIDGSLDNEVALGIDENANFEYLFDHCALTIDANPELGHYDLSNTAHFSQNMFNGNWAYIESPLLPADQWKFVPDTTSVLGQKASAATISPTADLFGTTRANPATIGAVERPE